MALNPGAAFGAYRIIEPLGRGGMAAVHKAYEPGLDRYVALKVLPAEFMHEPGFAERFEREAKLVAKLEHRHIVPIYNFGIEERIPWMAMRLVPGGTLAALLRGERLDRPRALAILREAAEALDHAHSQAVLHRDVKPQNILLDSNGHVYLADFGIAKIVEGAALVTRSGVITGTPQYMSPEQWRGEKVDHRTDIYALGVVAYEMLAGRVPFSADTPAAMMTKHLMDPIPIPGANEVPEPLLRPLLKCLDKNPEARWPSASSFVGTLEKGAVAEANGSGATITLLAMGAPTDTPRHSAVPGVAAPVPSSGKRVGAKRLAFLVYLALGSVVAGWLGQRFLVRRANLAKLTIAGDWEGSYMSMRIGGGRARLVLVQTGPAISGTWTTEPDAAMRTLFLPKPDGSIEKVDNPGNGGTVSGTSGTVNAEGTSLTFPLTLSPSDPRNCKLSATLTTTVFASKTMDPILQQLGVVRHMLGQWATMDCPNTSTGSLILVRFGA